jgi:hypothetical protein
MGRHHHFSSLVSGICRFVTLAFAIGFCGASAGRSATTAPVTAQASVTSPEQKARDVLLAFLKEMEPVRLESITSLKLDRDQIKSRLTTLQQTGRTQDLADTYLYYLTQLDPSPSDYADALLSLAKVITQRDDDAGLLTLLFELANYFPDSTESVPQMRLLEAQYLLRIGGPEAALVLMHRVADNTATLPPERVESAARAGYIHERLGQTDFAITAYLQAGQGLAVEPMANEAQLRGSLLLLEEGRMDEALAAIQKLHDVPLVILGQSGSTAHIIADLLDLVSDPSNARAYWATQNKWFPRWQALSSQLGLKASPPEQPVLAPFIEDYRQLELQAVNALGQTDVAGYFQLVDQLFRSARWRPADLNDGMNLLYQGIRLVPDQADAVLAFGEAVEKDLPPANKDLVTALTELRVAELVLALNKYDVGRDVAQPVLERDGAVGSAGQALARLYGLAVLRSNSTSTYGAAAVGFLAPTLADPTAHGEQRLQAVAILCDLYTTLRRDGDARTLLEKELAQPGDPKNQLRITLQNELEALRQRSLQAAGLDAGLSGWWSQHSLPWYDYVNAKPQAGPLSTVDDPAVQVSRDFARALDNSAPLPVRAVSFESAWGPYIEMLSTGSAVVEAASTFALRQDIPLELRYLAWSRAVLHLFWTGQRSAAEKLLVLAPSGGANADDDRADFNLWDDYLTQPNTAAAQQAFADKITALPAVRRPVLLLAMRIINSLASLNETGAAQSFFDGLGKAKLDDEAAQQYKGLQTNIGALMQNYQATGLIADALRQVILDARPQEAAAAQLPANWLALNDIWSPNLALLSLAEVRQGLLAIIRDRIAYGRHPLQPFLDYAEALTFSPTDTDLRMKIFETVQQSAQRDDDRFYAAMFTSVIDFDNAEVARLGWAALASSRTANYPKAAGFIQYYDTLMKWRTGEKIDPVLDFGPLSAPDLDSYKLRLAFDYYLQQSDRDALQKLIDSRDEKDFLFQPVLGGYLKALHFLGKEAALSRASDAARLELAKAVVQSWARPDSESAGQVFELAQILHDPKAYPRAWVQSLLAAVHNENSRNLLLMQDGMLQGDWASVNDAADDYLTRNPTNYDAYWSKAEALVNLGRRREAIDPLRLYVKYSHNEDDYPDAVVLLKKIESESTTPAASK